MRKSFNWLSMGVKKTNCRGRLARSGTVAGSLPQLANMLTIQELQIWKCCTRINITPAKKTGLPFRITSNYTRQHIITMPRRLRKRNVYEEVARLLDIPGGEQIVKESYAQMRKFNCWNISIVQQYGRFKESRIRSAVFGNSRQFFLMRQNDRADLEDMGHDIGLTELTKHAILSYPLPDQQTGEKFAAFTYLHSDAQNPICGTVQNVVSPEMLYISGSSGAQFDERARELRGSHDVVSAIAASTTVEPK